MRVLLCNVPQEETAVVVFAVFLVVGYILWLRHAQRKHAEHLCQLQQEEASSDREWTVQRQGQHNGHWYSQTQPFHVHLYSAFLDVRRTLRAQPQIAIIGVLDRRLVALQPSLWCMLVVIAIPK